MPPQEESSRLERHPRWNFLDVTLIALGLLAVLCVYFNWIRPLRFSQTIERESVPVAAEAVLLLPEDLQWMKAVLPVGEEKHDVYGTLEWKILEIGEREILPGQKRTVVRVYLMVYASSTSVPRYGKYPLVKGSEILLSNSRFMLQGRLISHVLLNEKAKGEHEN